MRIAQVAPLTEAVPPKLYGGTERVVSLADRGTGRVGHDVTLFASGDSQTSAKLEATWPKALRLDGSVRDPNALHMVMLEHVRRKCDDEEFDILHFHLDYYPFSLFSRQPTPFLTTLHGRLDLPEHQPVFDTFSKVPVISISNAQRRPVPQANWLRTVHHGLPENLLTPQPVKPSYLALPRPHRAGEGRRPRDPDRDAMRHSAQDRRQGRPRRPGILRRADQAADREQSAGRIHRRDQRPREIGVPQRRDRPAGADRLAGAVRAGDDRGDGVRHAGDRLQPRLGAGDHRGRRDRLHRRGRNQRGRRGRPALAGSTARRSASEFEQRFTARRMALDYLAAYRSLMEAAKPHIKLVSSARIVQVR